jgi:beta-phosphoglucomutase family hydrolase
MNIETIISEYNIKAVIFDLDGTMLDNNSFHLKTWVQYLKNMGRDISEEEYKANINGRTNKDAVQYIYGRKLDDEEAMKYTLEKEAIYRNLYGDHIEPVNGLLDLLERVDAKKIPMAIATSGIQVNIDFMFDHIPMRHYFREIVNSSHITKGKPDPEIYLLTASLLGVPPQNCLVFEDSIVGIQSARSAGMKVIAVATTHSPEELKEADSVIRDFSQLTS